MFTVLYIALSIEFSMVIEPDDLRRVQQCESSRALVVLVPILIRNVSNLTSVKRAPENARIVELAPVFLNSLFKKDAAMIAFIICLGAQ